LQKVAAVGVTIAGITLTLGVVGGKSAVPFRLDSYGLVAAMLASFSFAFYNVGGNRILVRSDRWRVPSLDAHLRNSVLADRQSSRRGVAAHHTLVQPASLFVFSMISVLGSFSLYFLGLRYFEPTVPSSPAGLEPVFSIQLAAVLRGERRLAIAYLGRARFCRSPASSMSYGGSWGTKPDIEQSEISGLGGVYAELLRCAR